MKSLANCRTTISLATTEASLSMSKSDGHSCSQLISKVDLINQGQWPEFEDYSALVTSRHEIRLLELNPSIGGAPLACSLEPVSLDDELDFCALSYYWGAPVPKHKLRTVVINDSQTLLRPTLETFLRNLTSQVGSVWVWLDVLCINQKDVAEKSHQVSMMGEIYEKARTTYVWLGEGNADTDYACEYIQSGGTEGLMDKASVIGYIEQIFWRPYWRRMWILQEIVLSKQVQVLIGGKLIEWDKLDHATSELLFELHRRQQPSTMDAFKGMNSSDHKMDEENNTKLPIEHEKLFGSSPWENYSQIHEAREGSSTAGRALLDLMISFRKYFCVDDRDKVYALLALAEEKQISPNYAISVTELYFRILSASTSSCNPKFVNEYGHEVFVSTHIEPLVRLCVPPSGIDFLMCLDSARGYEFSHFFSWIGSVSLVKDFENDAVPMHRRHAWVSRCGGVDNQFLDTKCLHSDFGHCLEKCSTKIQATAKDKASLLQDELAQGLQKCLHVRENVKVGDLVFSLGTNRGSILGGLAAIVRDGRLVDIGIHTWHTEEPLIDREAKDVLFLKDILLIKQIMLQGIQMCEKGVHYHVAEKDWPVRDREFRLRKAIVPNYGVLFHIDRHVLVLLAILKTFDRVRIPDKLRVLLSTYSKSKVSPQPNQNPSVVNSRAIHEPRCTAAAMQSDGSKLYTYIKLHTNQLKRFRLPTWDHLSE